MFNPKYQINNKILYFLSLISEARATIDQAKLLPQNELKLKRQALIRMTHNSTQIEGNVLSLRQVEAVLGKQKVDAPLRDVYEVQNYLKALRYIEEVVQKKQVINEKVLLKIHRLVTAKTLPKEQSGAYRKGMVHVVRRRIGRPQEIVYTGPKPKKIPKLCQNLIKWIQQSNKEKMSPVLMAGIAHQEIAAIHPFADGNGRTARALATLILYKRDYDFRHLFALEDYYNKNRPAYYEAINLGKKYEQRKVDFNPWLEYFVEGFEAEISQVRNKVFSLEFKKVDDKIESQIYLDPDQLKILEWLDQMGKITSSDVVDVLNCSKRSAQLYLKKLKDIKIIKQIGKGPSSAYILR